MKRGWKRIAVVLAVAAVALSVVAVAYGATQNRAQRRSPSGGACGALMSNPEAFKAMQDLRVEHQQEVRAWYDKYGADPTTAEARAALQQLRTEHWNDMRGLLKKSGVKTQGVGPGARGSGNCGGAGAGLGGGCGMMGAASY